MSCLAAEANVSEDALTDRAKSRRRPGRPSSIVEALFATGAYLGTALIAVLALLRILKLWRADLQVPLSNYWDALLTQMWVKGICEHGWYLHNPDLGAPGGMDMHDFPMADNLHFLLLKLLGAATGNWAVAFNLYYLLGFPLAAVTALFALRRFGVSWQSGIVVSLLYAFLPYHFERNLKHLFLASYYPVPLAVMVVLWLMLGRLRWPWPARGLPQTGHEGRDYLADRRRFWASTLVLVLIASAGIYYAFFTCYLLLIAAAGAALYQRRLQPIGAGVLLICVTAVGVLVNISPSLLYWQRHGTNAEVAKRPIDDAEFHGLKIGQLLLPAAEHRVKELGQLRQRYDRLVLSDGEKRGATLGCIGSAGFLFLLSLLLNGRRGERRNRLLDALAALNVFAVLLATIGGFGSLFSLLISPSIRGYNRLSIFIALFCLFAMGVLLDRLAAWWAALGKPAWQFRAALVALGVLGLIDQTGRGRVPDYAALKAQFIGDAQFVAEIERRLAPGAMVYQLPYLRFPEFPQSFALGEYELFRPYLHSKCLRWSYGAMKGRPADLWQRELAAKPLDGQLATLAEMGFRGITIDRFGYPDLAAKLEGQLSRLLNQSPLVSPDGRISFFTLPVAGASSARTRWWDSLRSAHRTTNQSRCLVGTSFATNCRHDSPHGCRFIPHRPLDFDFASRARSTVGHVGRGLGAPAVYTARAARGDRGRRASPRRRLVGLGGDAQSRSAVGHPARFHGNAAGRFAGHLA